MDESLAGFGELFVDFGFGRAEEMGDFDQGEVMSVAKQNRQVLGFANGGFNGFEQVHRLGVEPRADVFFPHKAFWVVERMDKRLPGDFAGCCGRVRVPIEEVKREPLNPRGELLDEKGSDGRVSCMTFLDLQGEGGFVEGHNERTI